MLLVGWAGEQGGLAHTAIAPGSTVLGIGVFLDMLVS